MKYIDFEYECPNCNFIHKIQVPKKKFKKAYSIDLKCEKCKEISYKLIFHKNKWKFIL